MPAIPYVFRRGAIYHWRRRLPLNPSCATGFISVSLRTSSPHIARILAAWLTNSSQIAFEKRKRGVITDQDLKNVVRIQAQRVDAYISALADLDRMDGDLPARGETGLTWVEHEAVTAELARRRASPVALGDFGPEDADALRERGWNARMIEVLRSFFGLSDFFGPSTYHRDQLNNLARAAGVEGQLSDFDLFRIDTAALRGSSAAHEKRARTFASTPQDEIIDAFGPDAAALPEPRFSRANPCAGTPLSDSRSPASDARLPMPPAVPADLTLTPILEVAELARTDKAGDGNWREKTQAQATTTMKLFAGYLLKEFGVVHIEGIMQHHLDAFDQLLRKISPIHGKAAEDKRLSVPTYIAKYTAPKSKHKSALSLRTRNRYWMFIGQLIQRAKKKGARITDIDVSAFWSSTKGSNARHDRVKPTPAQLRALFHSPVFTGCAGPELTKRNGLRPMHTPGPTVFHRGAYFVLIIAAYHGFRREEICGLAVDDIKSVGGNPIFSIADNKFRRIKNSQSEREQIIHPEVLRLGFLEYVEQIRLLGYDCVFPDLYSPGTKSAAGDRLYDELLPALRAAKLTPHHLRHFFDNTLKQRGVHQEIREDFMGHRGESESTNRYVDALHPECQLQHLEKIDIVTEHLQRQPICLLDWVRDKKSAPWARRKVGKPQSEIQALGKRRPVRAAKVTPKSEGQSPT
jgi:integrase